MFPVSINRCFSWPYHNTTVIWFIHSVFGGKFVFMLVLLWNIWCTNTTKPFFLSKFLLFFYPLLWVNSYLIMKPKFHHYFCMIWTQGCVIFLQNTCLRPFWPIRIFLDPSCLGVMGSNYSTWISDTSELAVFSMMWSPYNWWSGRSVKDSILCHYFRGLEPGTTSKLLMCKPRKKNSWVDTCL